VRFDVNEDKEVSGRSAALTLFAFSRTLSFEFVSTPGDFDVNCFVSLDFSETVTVFAGVLYVFSFPWHWLHVVLMVKKPVSVYLACAPARGACNRMGSGLGARAWQPSQGMFFGMEMSTSCRWQPR